MDFSDIVFTFYQPSSYSLWKAKADIKVCHPLELTQSPFELSRIFMWVWQTQTPNKSHHLGFPFFWVNGEDSFEGLNWDLLPHEQTARWDGRSHLVLGTWKVLIWTRWGKVHIPCANRKFVASSFELWRKECSNSSKWKKEPFLGEKL